MAFKEGQFDVVELMVNDQFKTKYQFECSTCDGNDSFCTVIRYSRVTCMPCYYSEEM